MNKFMNKVNSLSFSLANSYSNFKTPALISPPPRSFSSPYLGRALGLPSRSLSQAPLDSFSVLLFRKVVFVLFSALNLRIYFSRAS